MKNDWLERLSEQYHACGQATDWITENKFKSPKEAYDACKRADWMLWIQSQFVKTQRAKKKLMLVAIECAETSVRVLEMAGGFNHEVRRCKKALELAKKWAECERAPKKLVDELHEIRNSLCSEERCREEEELDVFDTLSIATHWDASLSAYGACESAINDDARMAKCVKIVRKHYPNPPRLTARKVAR